jgi:prolyl-tRNA editing enzyme YbaK/EbsC (Cys-tRNA(Pro) deacylase)
MNTLDYLDTENIAYELIELPNKVHTVEETASAMKCESSQILKSLLVQDSQDQSKMAVIILLGTKRLDFKKINQVCGFHDTRFVPMNDVLWKTGFEVWTLPPRGYGYKIPIFYDKDILDQWYVFAWSWKQDSLIKFNPQWLIGRVFF